MIGTYFVEDNFQKKISNLYRLSILLKKDSLLFCCQDQFDHLLFFRGISINAATQDDLSALKERLSAEPLLNLPYYSIKIALFHPLFTFVPARLYQEQQQTAYLEKAGALEADAITRADRLEDWSMVNVYGTDPSLLTLLANFFPDASFFHSVTPLLRFFLSQAAKTAGKMAFLHHEGEDTVMAVFNGTTLLLVNQFPTRSDEDLLYFLMLLFQQFKLDQERTPVYLSGTIENQSDTFQMLRSYTGNLSFCGSPSFLHYGPKGAKTAFGRIPDLLSLHLC